MIISAIVPEFYMNVQEFKCLTITKDFVGLWNKFYCLRLVCFETLDTLKHAIFIHNFRLREVEQQMNAKNKLVIAR